MRTQEKVTRALERAKKYLLETRGEDGLWSLPNAAYDLPAHYQNPFVKSTDACRALFTLLPFLSVAEVGQLEASLHQLLLHDVAPDAPVDHHAFKLLATAYANTPFAASIREATHTAILAQEKGGFWQTYSHTYHFTNFLILDAFHQNKLALPDFFPKWAWQRLNKQGDGWGFSREDTMQPSVTATILLCLILTGQSASDERISHIIAAIEKRQETDGGWPASSTTDAQHSVVFSTALILLLLLLTGHDLTRPSIQRALNYLLEAQNEDGSWGYRAHEMEGRFFTIFYTVHTLSFLQFSINPSRQEAFLKERLSSADYALHLYANFVQEIRERFCTNPIRRLLETRALGATEEARLRRHDILTLLSQHALLDDAAVIDALKAHNRPRYGHLKKRDHLTLIKNDLAYLTNLGLARKHGRKHYVVLMPKKESI